MNLHQRQVELEEEYSNLSLIAGQEQILKAFAQGRAADVGAGRILLAKAYEAGLEAFTAFLAKPQRGLAGKYRKLLRDAEPEVLVMAGLREILNKCATPEPTPMQTVLRGLGRVIEAETMLVYMSRISAQYTQRTVDYLDSAGTKSTSHRYRTFLTGARNMGLDWEQWSAEERIQAARLLLTELYNATGLFKWGTHDHTKGRSMYYLEPSDTLRKHFGEVEQAAKAIVKYPPMLVEPLDWQGQYGGGYLTDWFQYQSPMCGLRFIDKGQKAWVLQGLNSDRADPVRNAMNKTQKVPYRVNTAVLEVLKAALATRTGILGLPSYVAKPRPEFPLGDNWQKDEANEAELDQFSMWKSQMALWYTGEKKRVGRQTGILSRLQELKRYSTEKCIYFPTFIDWRGRLYFRSNLNPQSNDCIKGCLEFANGKRLGELGLFWLKVHVANCCGYDKHDPAIKAKWTEDNWIQILDFINNPLDVDAPDADTAFTLLQAGLALQEALELDDPTDYICHVPVAMDATCSGLQHLSALTRDPIGALYTNLIDNGADQKSDIYMQVASTADTLKSDYMQRKVKDEDGKTTTVDDPLMAQYWDGVDITRKMAKKPVMTYVYSSTLQSTIEGLALEMSDAGMPTITNDEGKVIYSLNKLAVPIGKALRKGVEDTVPEAARMMRYLQTLVRKHKDQCIRWVSPVGVPVVNWAVGTTTKRITIKSMGVTSVTVSFDKKEYNTQVAANGIVPNYIHSMDAAHLCSTINSFDGEILPIHDSFATHPSDVAAMHRTLRQTFIGQYLTYEIETLLGSNIISMRAFPPPAQGTFDLNEILNARYTFG